ncbi:putative holin-like toxin [Pediococcus damnosus]|nr:putative holin-like toxin [Pediococcus damnosus]
MRLRISVSNPDERSSLVSVIDALQLMLTFGIFLLSLLTFIVELIKNQQKK